MSPSAALQDYRASVMEFAELVRLLISYPDWFVPIDARGHALLWMAEDGAYMMALEQRTMPAGSNAEGWLEMRGRHLVRHLPEECAGVLFEAGQPWSRAVRGSDKAFRTIADALDVEDALAQPGPVQGELLLDHEWIVLSRDGAPAVDLSCYDTRVVWLFTAQDQLERFGATDQCGIIRSKPAFVPHTPMLVKGRELFALLAAREDYDGLIVNAEEWGYWPNPWQFLGPNFASELCAGEYSRADASILRARSLAEIDLFIDLAHGQLRSSRADSVGGLPVVRYEASVNHKHRRHWYFHPPEPLADPEDLGAGATEILCPGQLASELAAGICRLECDEDAQNPAWARRLLRWADELLKLIPVGADLMPRTRLRTTEGARLWRLRPEFRDRAWILERRAESLQLP